MDIDILTLFFSLLLTFLFGVVFFQLNAFISEHNNSKISSLKADRDCYKEMLGKRTAEMDEKNKIIAKYEALIQNKMREGV